MKEEFKKKEQKEGYFDSENERCEKEGYFVE